MIVWQWPLPSRFPLGWNGPEPRSGDQVLTFLHRMSAFYYTAGDVCTSLDHVRLHLSPGRLSGFVRATFPAWMDLFHASSPQFSRRLSSRSLTSARGRVHSVPNKDQTSATSAVGVRRTNAKQNKVKSQTRCNFYLPVVAIILALPLGAAAATAQENSVKMTFSGTAGSTAANLQIQNEIASDYNFSGKGTLGSFDFHSVSASVPAQQPSTCSGSMKIYSEAKAGPAVFSLRRRQSIDAYAHARIRLHRSSSQPGPLSQSVSNHWWHRSFCPCVRHAHVY